MAVIASGCLLLIALSYSAVILLASHGSSLDVVDGLSSSLVPYQPFVHAAGVLLSLCSLLFAMFILRNRRNSDFMIGGKKTVLVIAAISVVNTAYLAYEVVRYLQY